MKRITRLTESDLNRIIKRVINEQPTPPIKNKNQIYVRPGITIDCSRDFKLITKTDLPWKEADCLDNECLDKIAKHYCGKQ
jgi:hypothetical protein